MATLRRYLSTLIAILLSVILVYVLPLPLDGIGKLLVVLATFAAVYSVEGLLQRRRKAEDQTES